MKKLAFTLFAAFAALMVFAQDKKVDVKVNSGGLSITKHNEWYEQPWVWVVGAAVFILLLVAITRSGRRSNG